MVLIRGDRGVKSHCIQGVKDLLGIPNRRETDQNMVQKNPNRYEFYIVKII